MPRVIAALEPPPSPARVEPPARAPFVVGAVQERWRPDPAAHAAALIEGVQAAAAAGAQLVCLQELTLSRYLDGAAPEPLPGGPTHELAARAAGAAGVPVVASLHERAGEGERGFNTAIVVGADGALLGRTRKLHIPSSGAYGEDRFFDPGPADDPFPIVEVGAARLGAPTCYDQWFTEVARGYGLAGADVVVYPSAIGTEPGRPGFDTQPMWRQVIVGGAIANGLFAVAVNRVGSEGDMTFYGSSFVADPYGRVLVQAPRDEPAVLVAALDLDQRRDWLDAFPFYRALRPDAYAPGLATMSAITRTRITSSIRV